MRAGNTDDCIFNGSAAGIFRLLHGSLDRDDGFLKIDNQALARASRLRQAMPAVAQAVFGGFRHQNGGLGAAEINCGEQIGIQFSHESERT